MVTGLTAAEGGVESMGVHHLLMAGYCLGKDRRVVRDRSDITRFYIEDIMWLSLSKATLILEESRCGIQNALIIESGSSCLSCYIPLGIVLGVLGSSRVISEYPVSCRQCARSRRRRRRAGQAWCQTPEPAEQRSCHACHTGNKITLLAFGARSDI